MPVYALEDALRDGGTHFDLVLTDTCLMASLEMSQALAPYADYLAASEEVMSSGGTDYERWVQYLNRISDYIESKEIRIQKDMKIDRENLPAGEYRVRFITRDVFNNRHYSNYVSLKWDGKTVSDCQVLG